MKLHGWGRYPVTDATVMAPVDRASLASSLSLADNASTVIARGSARSYGDSSLAGQVISSRFLDNFISFDTSSGELHCGAGVTLEQVLNTCVPAGWFLPVVPGTRFVSVGGAIASDIHGKNHHLDGCFSQHVHAITLMLASGEVVTCSPTHQQDLFRATCGGMGLTGIILDAKLRLEKIDSAFIEQRTLIAANLDQIFALFDEFHACKYSVAWLDCLARGPRLGRSVLFLGEWAKAGDLALNNPLAVAAPPFSPSLLLNRYSVSAFNATYFQRHRIGKKAARLHYNPFFFPLDRILNWNRLYGGRGFVQYQFVVPTDSAQPAIKAVLEAVSEKGLGSFLSVLKKMGPANENFLSFPLEGYTLALDFKLHPDLFPLLESLDRIVQEHGGRLYLSKDARMSQAMFEQGYPGLAKFQALRQKVDPHNRFGSLQSARLGITPP